MAITMFFYVSLLIRIREASIINTELCSAMAWSSCNIYTNQSVRPRQYPCSILLEEKNQPCHSLVANRLVPIPLNLIETQRPASGKLDIRLACYRALTHQRFNRLLNRWWHNQAHRVSSVRPTCADGKSPPRQGLLSLVR